MIKMNCTDKPPTKQKSKYFLGTIFCHGSVKEFHIQLPVHVHYKGKAYCLILQWRIQRLISAHREREAQAWENQSPVGGRGRSPRKILTIYWLKLRF